jgi:hypothetical protein
MNVASSRQWGAPTVSRLEAAVDGSASGRCCTDRLDRRGHRIATGCGHDEPETHGPFSTASHIHQSQIVTSDAMRQTMGSSARASSW